MGEWILPVFLSMELDAVDVNANLMPTVGPTFHYISGYHFCLLLTSKLVEFRRKPKLWLRVGGYKFDRSAHISFISCSLVFLSNLYNALFHCLFILIALDFWPYVTFQQILEDL